MTMQEITKLVHSAGTATLGFLDAEGCPGMRMLFSTWHKGLGTHLFSTCPGSVHVQALQQNGAACLYYHDDTAAVCFSGRVTVHSDHAYKALLWQEGDEKYYPGGIDDPNYCVLEFTAERARTYRFDGVDDLTGETLQQWDQGAEMRNYA